MYYRFIDYKYLKISIAAIIKIPEMIRFVPNHLKKQNCVNMQLKNRNL